MKMQCVFPRKGQVTVGRDSGEEIGGWGGARVGGERSWGRECWGGGRSWGWDKRMDRSWGESVRREWEGRG